MNIDSERQTTNSNVKIAITPHNLYAYIMIPTWVGSSILPSQEYKPMLHLLKAAYLPGSDQVPNYQ